MTASQRIYVAAFAFATIIVGVIWWYWPGMRWEVALFLWVILAGSACGAWIKQAAAERIVDENDRKRRS